MITKTEWSKFRKWREIAATKVLKSKEYKDLQKKIDDLKLPEPVKSKFLFWESETYPSHLSYINHDLEFYRLISLRESLFRHIPEETLEGCLNWLTEDKRKKSVTS